jgi:hypothetical protein
MLTRIVLAVLACAAFTAAQTAVADTAKKAAPAAKSRSVAPVSSIYGTVVAVDTVAKTLIIKAKTGEDTLAVDTAAVIRAGGKKISLGELKAETRVTATCKMVEGKKVAVKVTERVAAAKPKKDSTAAATDTGKAK